MTMWREDLFPSLGTFFAASGENPSRAGLCQQPVRAAGDASPSLRLSSHLVSRTAELSLSPLPGGPHPLGGALWKRNLALGNQR